MKAHIPSLTEGILNPIELIWASITALSQKPFALVLMIGLCTGTWPHLQRNSGLTSHNFFITFIAVQAALFLPFGLVILSKNVNVGSILMASFISVSLVAFCHRHFARNANWVPIIIICLLSGFGLICMFQMIMITKSSGIHMAIAIGLQILVVMAISMYRVPADFHGIRMIAFILMIMSIFFFYVKVE